MLKNKIVINLIFLLAFVAPFTVQGAACSDSLSSLRRLEDDCGWRSIWSFHPYQLKRTCENGVSSVLPESVPAAQAIVVLTSSILRHAPSNSRIIDEYGVTPVAIGSMEVASSDQPSIGLLSAVDVLRSKSLKSNLLNIFPNSGSGIVRDYSAFVAACSDSSSDRHPDLMKSYSDLGLHRPEQGSVDAQRLLFKLSPPEGSVVTVTYEMYPVRISPVRQR